MLKKSQKNRRRMKKGGVCLLGSTHVPMGVAFGGLLGLMWSENIVQKYEGLETIALLGTVTVGCACGGFGGLLPDLDARNSKISRRFPWVSKLACQMTRVTRPKVHGLHVRGFTHELYVWVILLAPLLLHLPFIGWGIFIGILSHLLLDACNPAGIAFFAPFSRKRTRFLRVPSGSKGEIWFRILAYILCLMVIYLAVFQILV